MLKLLCEIFGSFLFIYLALYIKHKLDIKNNIIHSLITLGLAYTFAYLLTNFLDSTVYLNPSSTILNYSSTMKTDYLILIILCQMFGFLLAFKLFK